MRPGAGVSRSPVRRLAPNSAQVAFPPRLSSSRIVRTPALAYRDMRLLAASGAFDAVGFMGEHLVLGWLMLELTDSAFMVGAVLGIRMAPAFFLGAVAGALADIVDRRLTMILINGPLAATAATAGALFHFGVLEAWHLFVLAAAGGCMPPLKMTLQQSYVADVVGPANLLNGLAFLNIGTRGGGLLGTIALGFVLEHLGAGYAYFTMASTYLVTAGILAFTRGTSRPDAARPRAVGLRGLLHVVGEVVGNIARLAAELRRNRLLLTLAVTTMTVEFAGFSHFSLYPSLARDVLDVGAQELGFMNSARALGGVLSVIVVAVVGGQARRGLSYMFIMLAFGLGVIMFAFTSNFWLVLAFIAMVNGMASLLDLYSQSMMQTIVPFELRGRAAGAWVVATGTGPLGSLQIGALATSTTIAFALGANGAVLVVLAVLGLALLPTLRRL